jgi:hypothetical protein
VGFQSLVKAAEADLADCDVAQHGRDVAMFPQAAERRVGLLVLGQRLGVTILAKKDVSYVARQPRQPQMITEPVKDLLGAGGVSERIVVATEVDE